MILLDIDDILEIHKIVIEETGGDDGIRDYGMIESALYSTEAGFGDYHKYPSIEKKVARLCYGITMNHGFVDGNKRTAVNAMLSMLKLNNIDMLYSQKELVEIMLSLASGNIGYDQMLNWIKEHEFKAR